MAEKEAVLTLGEAAEFLGVNDSTASNVLAYMEALEVVQCVKRGRRHFYILKGAYDEERLSEILIWVGAKPPPRRRGSSREPKKSKYDLILDRFLDGEHRLVEVGVAPLDLFEHRLMGPRPDVQRIFQKL